MTQPGLTMTEAGQLCSGHDPQAGTLRSAIPTAPIRPSQPDPPGGGEWPLRSHMTYGPLLDTVPTARARTKALLLEWGIMPGDLLSDSLVVVTELVSNAVVASRALPQARPVRVGVCSDRARLLVQVGDESPAPPLWLAPGVDAERGRGLLVVQQLSSNWGWYPATSHGVAKVAWAVLDTGPAPSRQAAEPSQPGKVR